MSEGLDFVSNRLILLDLSPFGIPRSHCYIYLDNWNHLQMSGNKIRKLYGSIQYMKSQNLTTLITVGGNYSNYLHACSYLPELENIQCVFIIKGHQPKKYGHTLQHIQNKNIPHYFYPKEVLKNNLESTIAELQKIYPNSYYIPEGGKNEWSHLGFEPLIQEEMKTFDTICVPVGSLATYQGIQHYLPPHTKLIGYAAHKDYSFVSDALDIRYDYSFGGFAKMTSELMDFAIHFHKEYHILLDPVYTAKMMYGIVQDYKKGIIFHNEKIVAIHTGGLQGWYGMNEKHNEMEYIYQYIG